MSTPLPRILLVDDNHAIHQDYRKILEPQNSRVELATLEAELFDEPISKVAGSFQLTSAFQGQDAIQEVENAKAAGAPFSVAFVDIRMPPGIDGVETTAKLWKIDPDLQVILCSAHSDYSFVDVLQRLGATDRLLILKKPFENIEVLQIALSLTQKWNFLQASRAKIEQLDAAVEARTRALKETSRQLFEAHKLEAVARLANGMAHEVNNPLAVTMASLDFIKEELTRVSSTNPELTEAVDACEHALEGAGRIVAIVEAVRGFARTQGGTSESLSLAVFLNEALSRIQTELPEGIALERDLQPTPKILAPVGGLTLALSSLISNAVMARPGTGDLYTIHVTAGIEANGWPYLEVRDEGVGIAPENLPKLFEPFFTTRPVGMGTGLGLCATHGLISRLGGTVEVRSELGKGTRVRLRIPPDPTN
jgi:signal transduction histidine kinase